MGRSVSSTPRSHVRFLVGSVAMAVAVAGFGVGPNLVAPAAASPAAAPSGQSDPDLSEVEASALAATSGEPVEVTSATSQTNQVMAQPDGSFVLESTREAVRTDINGGWEPIDTTLAVAADGSVSPRAITIPVEFGAGDSSRVVTAGAGSDAWAFDLVGVTLPDPVVSGSQVTYPAVRPGVDLVLTAHPSGVTDALVVKSAAAAQGLVSDPLEFEGTSAGLNVTASADGGLVATNPVTGTTLVAGAPVAWDSSGGGQGSDKPDADSSGTGEVHPLPGAEVVDDGVGAGDSQVSVSVVPPAGLVNDPTTAYPLFLDPPIAGLDSAAYLTVHSNGWDYFNNSAQPMRVGNCGWAECNPDTQGVARSFFTFSTPSLAHADADPVVYYAKVSVQQIWNATSSAQPVNLRSADSTFSATTNWPGPTGNQIEQISSAAGGGSNADAWLNFDSDPVREYVEDRAASELSLLRFGLRAPNESDRNQWKKFNNQASLTVKYGYAPRIDSASASPMISCPGKVVYAANKSFTMTETVTAFGSSGGGISYARVLNNSDLVQFWSSGWGTSPSGATPTLADGVYTWRVGARQEVTGYVGPQTWTGLTAHVFTVDSQVPTSSGVISSDDYPVDSWGQPAGYAGKFNLTGLPSDVVGVKYSFNNDVVASVPTTECGYSGPGYAKAASNAATVTAPTTGLVAGALNTLNVRAFDAAHNMATVVSYQFYVPKAFGTVGSNRVEAESPTVNIDRSGATSYAGQLAVGAVPGPGPGGFLTVSGTGSEAADKVTLGLGSKSPGYYAVGIRLQPCTTSCKPVTFTLPGGKPVTTTPGAGGSYVSVGGFSVADTDPSTDNDTTPPAPVALEVSFPESSPQEPTQVGLDYVTVAQIQGGVYASLAAAFNNNGIAAPGATPGASLDGNGFGLSTAALTSLATGISSGQTWTPTFKDRAGNNVTATFTIPTWQSDGEFLDNVIAAGQHITMPGTFVEHVDFLVATTCRELNPDQTIQFDLIHEDPDDPDADPYYGIAGVPGDVPNWDAPAPGSSTGGVTAVTVQGRVSGTPAVAQTGDANLYVIEVDVPAEFVNYRLPLMEIGLPSTGANLMPGELGCATQPDTTEPPPQLHVLAVTTR